MSATGIMDSYESLANAVVLQAVRDYREAVRILFHGRKNTAAETTKNECERFFKSSYFNLFTELDGKALLEQLEREVVT